MGDGLVDRKVPDQRYVRDYEKGLTYRQIAKKYGCSLSSVNYHLHQAGVTARSQGKGPTITDADDLEKRYRAGESSRSLALRYGVSERTIDKTLRRNGVPTRSVIKRAMLDQP